MTECGSFTGPLRRGRDVSVDKASVPREQRHVRGTARPHPARSSGRPRRGPRPMPGPRAATFAGSWMREGRVWGRHAWQRQGLASSPGRGFDRSAAQEAGPPGGPGLKPGSGHREGGGGAGCTGWREGGCRRTTCVGGMNAVTNSLAVPSIVLGPDTKRHLHALKSCVARISPLPAVPEPLVPASSPRSWGA